MTKQEAIEQLRFDKELAKRDYISPTNHEEYDLAILALEKQLNNGWIPVSERLPSNDCICIVSDGEHVFLSNHDACLGFGNYKFNKKSVSFKELNNVIAWQPLPGPYKEV